MLTIDEALRSYAAMMNTLDADRLAPLLSVDFHYASQWVFEEITSRDAYLEYIRSKLKSVESAGSTVWAEMGHLDREIPGPCVVLAQDDKDDLVAVVIGKVENGKLVRLDLCGAPSPRSARRTGVYPGREG